MSHILLIFQNAHLFLWNHSLCLFNIIPKYSSYNLSHLTPLSINHVPVVRQEPHNVQSTYNYSWSEIEGETLLEFVKYTSPIYLLNTGVAQRCGYIGLKTLREVFVY